MNKSETLMSTKEDIITKAKNGISEKGYYTISSCNAVNWNKLDTVPFSIYTTTRLKIFVLIMKSITEFMTGSLQKSFNVNAFAWKQTADFSNTSHQ